MTIGTTGINDLASEISDIRYGQLGTILFTFNGKTVSIAEPIDVLLVGYDVPASKWIVANYGYLLAQIG